MLSKVKKGMKQINPLYILMLFFSLQVLPQEKEQDTDIVKQTAALVQQAGNAATQTIDQDICEKDELDDDTGDLDDQYDDDDLEDDYDDDEYEDDDEDEEDDDFQLRTINEIIVIGNKHIPKEAILDRVPYRKGEPFNPEKTRSLIRNLYYELKRFKHISIEGENLGKDLINIYIIVEEKKPLIDVQFEGNTQVSEKEIGERINFHDIPAIDEPELNKFVNIINKIYVEKGYMLTEIKPEIIEIDDKVKVVFHFTEHKKSVIKRIIFCGNNHISGKTLRGIMFSREDWILSFMDKAGTYNPEWLMRDKHIIEQYYQNNGFMNAKVIDTEVCTDPDTKHVHIHIEVNEGDLYRFGDISIDGKDILSEEFLLAHLPIGTGDIYSREEIVNSIKFFEFMFGDLGYLYTQVEPTIQPNDDTKCVDIHFNIEPGNRIYLYRCQSLEMQKHHASSTYSRDLDA